MKIDIVEKIITSISKEKIKKVVINAFQKLNLTGDKEIEILFVDKKEIAKLNQKFRGIKKETDVLSFPQQQISIRHTILGSIVICEEVVSEKRENMTDVIKHGILHLANYDHENNEEKWNDAAKKIGCNL